MTSLTVYILLAILTSVVVVSITIIIYSRLKRTRYDEENKRIELESIRDSIEKQIYGLNDRLIQNEERWKDVNHLLLRNEYIENNNPITNSRRTYYSDFLRANGITENDLLIDEKLIFILTPFNDKYIRDYLLIREICSSQGYKCIRGDENNIKGDIFPEMLKLIVKANLIIANVNGRNPNVLYELGIAQALDKPVILISRTPHELPIDIKSKRFLIYSTENQLHDLILQELKNIQ